MQYPSILKYLIVLQNTYFNVDVLICVIVSFPTRLKLLYVSFLVFSLFLKRFNLK